LLPPSSPATSTSSACPRPAQERRRTRTPISTPSRPRNFFFLYGHFEEARKRFEPIYKEQCGKTEYGYKAWIRLTTMANIAHDIDEGRALAAAAVAKSCAMDAGQKEGRRDRHRDDQHGLLRRRRGKAFKKAEKHEGGDPERPKARGARPRRSTRSRSRRPPPATRRPRPR
jgi:hypothetical protein